MDKLLRGHMPLTGWVRTKSSKYIKGFYDSKSLKCCFLFHLLQIVLQTLLAFAVTCYGIVHIAGEFKDMDATSELKNKYDIDTLRNHPSFYVFNHRGRVLFQSPDALHSSSSSRDTLSSSASLKLRKFEPLRRYQWQDNCHE
nr:membrane magnesium transporter 1-like [Zootoca vivipara]